MINYNPFSLEGKTVLVTGASSGIGQATAIECSKMGAKLVITGRNAERLQETFDQLEGEGHRQVIAELTNDDDIKRLVDECSDLHGVVLCAGKGLTLPFNFCTREKFDEMFAVNYFAPVELLRQLSKKKKILKYSKSFSAEELSQTHSSITQRARNMSKARDYHGTGKLNKSRVITIRNWSGLRKSFVILCWYTEDT